MKKDPRIIPELEHLCTLPIQADRVIGRRKYPHYAVFVPFLSVDGETHWLFEKRSEGIRQGGEICFPGGAVELTDGEAPEEAARRETAEELGIPLSSIEIVGYFGHLLTRWGGLIDVFYGTFVEPSETLDCKKGTQDPISHSKTLRLHTLSLSPKPEEVKEVFTVPLSFFRTVEPEVHLFRQIIQPRFTDAKGTRHVLPWKRLGIGSRYSRAFSLHTYPVYFYRYRGNTIWGITADIIKEFLDVLNFT
ncbi:MAG: CoA pyrophosphatase [Spirochaetes bacterium]|nr:CoA pyrophosphatase [Spirochaetota bacterium]